MGYINFKHLYEKELTDEDYLTLQKVFQKEFTLLEPKTAILRRLLDRGLIQYLKGKENSIEAVRISKKGKALLSQLDNMHYSDSIGKLVDDLIGLYATYNKKHIGNKLEIQNRLLWFVGQTGFNARTIAETVEEYLQFNDKYTKSLENLIWTPPSKAFSVHKHLKDSKLYDLICKKYGLDETFLIEPQNKEIEWLGNIARITVPRRMNKELYFKGSFSKDHEHILKLKEKYQNLIYKK